MEWLDIRAKDILDVQNQYINIMTELESKDLSRAKRCSLASKGILSFRFRILPGENQPWHAPLIAINQLRYLYDKLVDACFIVISGFVGMRIHEILSLKPGCVEQRQSADGLLDIFYLVARTYKFSPEQDGEVSRWVAGARAIGQTDVPPPVLAAQILERLTLPWRQHYGIEPLFFSLGCSSGMAWKSSSHRPTRFNIRDINDRMNKFASMIELASSWVFSSHQGRKTFARFVGRMDKSNLHALSQQFQHVSVAMTDASYVGTDFELDELIDAEAKAETAAALERIVSSEGLAGKMGETLSQRLAQFRGRIKDNTAEFINWVLEDTDLHIHACDWGYCLYRQETAACNGGPKGPNYAKRGVKVCLGCKNLAVTKTHTNFWQIRRKRNHDLLNNAPPIKQAVISETIAECDGILTQLDKQVEK